MLAARPAICIALWLATHLIAGAATNPVPTLSATSIDFGSANVGAQVQRTLVVTNPDSLHAVMVQGIAMPDAAFSCLQGTPTVIPSGGTVTLGLNFQPRRAGVLSGDVTLTFTTVDATLTRKVAVTGTGLLPEYVPGFKPGHLVLVPGALTFTKVVGEQESQTMTLTNDGGWPVSFDTTSPVTTSVGPLALSPSAGLLQPGASVTLTMTFTATEATDISGSTVNSGITLQTRGVSGTSSNTTVPFALPATLKTRRVSGWQLDTPALDFGDLAVGLTKQLRLNYRNTGNGTLNLTAITPPDASFTVLGGSLPKESSGELSVTFAPTTMGDHSGLLTFQTNDPAHPTVQVPVTARAQAAPVAQISPGGLYYQTYENAMINQPRQTLTISNTGAGPLHWSVGTGSADWIHVEPASGTVAPGATMDVIVEGFPVPTLTSGTQAGAVFFTTNDPAHRNLELYVDITAVQAPHARVSPAAAAFADVSLNGTKAQTFTITNTGPVACTVTGADVGGAAFSLASPFTATPLASGASTTLTVNFQPTVLGPATGTLTVTTTDPRHSILTVPLTGTGAPPPTPVVTPSSLTATINAGSINGAPLTITGTGSPATFDWSASVRVLTRPAGAPAVTQPSLFDVLASVNSRAQTLINAIPSRVDFAGGETGDHITHDASGFFKDGNRVLVDGVQVSYSDNVISADSAAYFTRKLPGLFVGVYEANSLRILHQMDSAAYDGFADPRIFDVTRDGRQYRGSLSRITPQDTTRPMVFNLVIAEGQTLTADTFASGNFNDPSSWSWVSLTNNYSGGKKRLYQLTFATANSRYLTDAEAKSLMTTFLDSLAPPWSDAIGLTRTSGTASQGTPQTTDLIAPLPTQTPGIYTGFVDFTPQVPGSSVISVPFTLTVGTTPILRPLWGSEVDFGSIATGSSTSLSIEMRNDGAQPLVLSAVDVPSAVFTAGAPVVSGTSVYFRVTFAPKTAGTYNGNVVIHSNDPLRPVLTVPITASAYGTPRLELPAGMVTDGLTMVTDQNGLAQGTLNFSNSGDADLQWSVDETQVLQQPDGTSSNRSITFAPSSGLLPFQAGSNSASLALSFNNQSPRLSPGLYRTRIIFRRVSAAGDYTVIGQAVPVRLLVRDPIPAVSPTSLNYGATTGFTQTVKVTNNDSAPLTLQSVSMPDLAYGTGSTTFPLTVPSGSYVTFPVVFAPRFRGTYTGSMVINTSSSQRPALTVALIGAGDSSLPLPPLQVSASKLTFQVVNGQTSSQTIQITNLGTVPLRCSATGALQWRGYYDYSDPGVAIAGLTSDLLQPGASRDVTITVRRKQEWGREQTTGFVSFEIGGRSVASVSLQVDYRAPKIQQLIASPVRHAMYALDGAGRVLVLDSLTGAELSAFTLAHPANAITLDPAGTYLYALMADYRMIWRLDTRDLTKTQTITVPYAKLGWAWDSKFAASASGMVFVSGGNTVSTNIYFGIDQVSFASAREISMIRPQPSWNMGYANYPFTVRRTQPALLVSANRGTSYFDGRMWSFGITSTGLQPSAAYAAGSGATNATPLLTWAEEAVFMGRARYSTATRQETAQFVSAIQAISRDGAVALGDQALFDGKTGAELTTLPFSTQVAAFDQDNAVLWRFDPVREELVKSNLGDIALVGGPSVDFGTVAVAKTDTRTVTVRNVGAMHLSNVRTTIDGPGAASFSVATLPTSLPPRSDTPLSISLKPATDDPLSATLHLFSSDADTPEITIPLSGTGVAAAALPVINTPPVSAIEPEGGYVTFTVQASGDGPLSYRWKHGKAVVGTNSPTLDLRPLRSTHAGTYTVEVTNPKGTVATAPFQLVVFRSTYSSADALIAYENQPLTLKSTVWGAGASLVWQRDGTALSDSARIKGSRTAACAFKPALVGDSGRCTLVVTAGSASRVIESLPLVVRPAPVITTTALGPWRVGMPVFETAAAQADGLIKFFAKDLPPGITVNSATGQFIGFPTVAGDYTITLTASNGAGLSAPVSLPVTVAATAPPELTGTFVGLTVNRSGTRQELGAQFQITVTGNGRFTGTLLASGLRTSVAGPLEWQPGDTKGVASIGDGLTTVTLEVDAADTGCRAFLSTTASGEIRPMHAYRSPWSATRPATALAGQWNALVVHPYRYRYIGTTCAKTVVTANGNVAWTARLADGASATASCALGPDGEALLYVLCPPTGSAFVDQQLKLTPTGTDLTGAMDWFKPVTRRNSSLPDENLTIEQHVSPVRGERYKAPVRPALVLGLPGGAYNANVRFVTNDWNVDSLLPSDGKITITATAITPSSAFRDAHLSLAYNTSTGDITGSMSFSGTLNFTRWNPSTGTTSDVFQKVTHTATISGLFVPSLGAGGGSFRYLPFNGYVGDYDDRNKLPTYSGSFSIYP